MDLGSGLSKLALVETVSAFFPSSGVTGLYDLHLRAVVSQALGCSKSDPEKKPAFSGFFALYYQAPWLAK